MGDDGSIDALLRKWSADQPSTLAGIRQVEAVLGFSVPPDLIEFLTRRGPGEGFVGDGDYLRIDPPEEWPGLHSTLDASRFWPGLLIFGSDGSNGLFAFDTGSKTYVEVDAIGDRRRRPLGRAFDEFVRALAAVTDAG